MKYNIIDIAWRSAAHTVGFVAYATLNPANPGEWNSVVGYKPELRIIDTFTGDVLINVTSSQAEDAQYIAAHGAKIEWQIAQILFPTLAIKKHKYYTGVKIEQQKDKERGINK